MSGRAQMASTRRGGLRADAARDRKPRNKDKNKGKDKDKKRPKRPKRLPDTQPGRQLDNSAFRWFLAETRSAKRLEITDIVESVEWSDSSDSDNVNSWPILSATLAVRKSPSVAFPDLTPNRIVDCFCEGERIWRARIVKPTSSAIDGSVSIELQDELRQLALPRANFRYVADKAHKGGWSPDEIAKDICRQYKIPYVRFLVMRVNGTGEPIRLAKVEKKKASPFDVIQYAYEEARKRSAHRYIMRWNTEENGLEAVPMVESDTLYAFYARQISDAQSEMTLRTDFCTALRVTWYKPKPKKASSKWKPKKQTLKFPVYKDGKKVYSGRGKKKKAKTTNVLLPPNANDVISRYGYVERRVEFSARNIKEARARAKSELAKRLRPKKTLTFTAPGEPNIRRGDFIKVNLPEQGFDLTQVWVQSVTHSIGDRYTMEVTARFDNPFSPSVIKREQQKAARYKKAAERKDKKKTAGSGSGSGTSGPGQLLAYGRRPKVGTVYTVGASTYGWTPEDDNGKDVLGKSLFTGNPSVAVMWYGNALGMKISGNGPDYQRKVRVSWNGRSTIGYLRDVGGGDAQNRYQGRSLAVTGTRRSPMPGKTRPRVIDLHVRVAKELGWTPSPGIDLVNMELL